MPGVTRGYERNFSPKGGISRRGTGSHSSGPSLENVRPVMAFSLAREARGFRGNSGVMGKVVTVSHARNSGFKFAWIRGLSGAGNQACGSSKKAFARGRYSRDVQVLSGRQTRRAGRTRSLASLRGVLHPFSTCSLSRQHLSYSLPFLRNTDSLWRAIAPPDSGGRPV